MHKEQIAELLYQAYETEQGGEKVYETALKCAENEDLREEWEKYLEQTREHIEIVREAMEAFGLNPDVETPGRLVVDQRAFVYPRTGRGFRSLAPARQCRLELCRRAALLPQGGGPAARRGRIS